MDDPRRHAAKYELRRITCTECNDRWCAYGWDEYGQWSPSNDTDLICPSCGHEEEG